MLPFFPHRLTVATVTHSRFAISSAVNLPVARNLAKRVFSL